MGRLGPRDVYSCAEGAQFDFFVMGQKFLAAPVHVYDALRKVNPV